MDSQANIKALVRLIEDPDELIYQQVRGELMKYGPDVVPVLEQSWEQDFYGLLFQKRILLLKSLLWRESPRTSPTLRKK